MLLIAQVRRRKITAHHRRRGEGLKEKEEKRATIVARREKEMPTGKSACGQTGDKRRGTVGDKIHYKILYRALQIILLQHQLSHNCSDCV